MKETTIMRDAPSFEESLIRVKAKIKPITDELKFEIFFNRVLRPAYIRYLEASKKSSK